MSVVGSVARMAEGAAIGSFILGNKDAALQFAGVALAAHVLKKITTPSVETSTYRVRSLAQLEYDLR